MTLRANTLRIEHPFFPLMKALLISVKKRECQTLAQVLSSQVFDTPDIQWVNCPTNNRL